MVDTGFYFFRKIGSNWYTFLRNYATKQNKILYTCRSITKENSHIWFLETHLFLSKTIKLKKSYIFYNSLHEKSARFRKVNGHNFGLFTSIFYPIKEKEEEENERHR